MMRPLLREMCFMWAVVMVLVIEECTVDCSFCTNITLVDNEQFLYMECFPRTKDYDRDCYFSVKNERSGFEHLVIIEGQYKKENRDKCVFKMPLQELDGEGEYTIHLVKALTMWYRTSITLSSPIAKIEACGPQTDVKNNFVKYGANIACVCTSDDVVLPRGTANWYQGNKKLDTTHTENGTRSTLILTSVTEDLGQNDYTCVAESVLGNHSELLNLTVTKPPSTKPVVSAYSRQNGNVLVQGDDVTITCSTYEGYPSVQSVTLTCGQHQPVTSNGTSTQLTLNKIGPSNSVINCICQATHVTGSYDLIGVLHLNILSANPYKADDKLFTMAQFVGGNIGSIVGLLVIGAVITLIVFCVRRETGKSKSRSEDTEYDNARRQASLPIENVQPRDHNYLTMNSAVQAPSSASPILKTDTIYSNQAYVDPADPTSTYESMDQIAQIPVV